MNSPRTKRKKKRAKKRGPTVLEQLFMARMRANLHRLEDENEELRRKQRGGR